MSGGLQVESIMKMTTQFLPAEKAPPEEIAQQHEMLAADPTVEGTLDAMLNLAVILNRQRQVVYANKALMDFLKLNDMESVTGRRVGDLFGCKRACETSGGCGTTEFCTTCGPANALNAALFGGEAVNECRISTVQSGHELDLRVRTRPFLFQGTEFVIAAFQDISAEKRRDVLERMFFHDIINTANGMQVMLNFMTELPAENIPAFVTAAADASNRLVEQILSQRDLYAAEKDELQTNLSEISALELLQSVANVFSGTAVARGLRIVVESAAQDIYMVSDKTLLSRVMGNLVKNALEAEQSGASITMSCRKTDDGAAFRVHNPSRMSEAVRKQVFQRSFSTKGAGRGLGTYSVRLLTEKYLKGRISFSTDDSGTTFTAEYPERLGS
jgi:signal transduction histidine kinase